MHNQKWQRFIFGINLFLLCIASNSIFAEVAMTEEPLSLQNAVQTAILKNLDLLAAKQTILLSKQSIEQARSQLSPQIKASTHWIQVDEDRARASYAGQQAQHEIVGVISATQLLYSESAQANLDIQHHLQRATEEDVKQLRLDIINKVATNYINLLSINDLVNKKQTYLNETRDYLTFAEKQNKQADIYRWQSEIARHRNILITLQAQVQQAEMQLNQILHQPLEETVLLPTIENPLSLIIDHFLLDKMRNVNIFKHFRDFMVEEGINHSPLLKRLESEIEAQTRTVLSARRASWSPIVALQGDIRHSINRFGVNNEIPQDMNDTDWYISANVSLPLYNGSEKNIALARSQQQLSRLRLQRQAIQERIETAIRTALRQVSVTYETIALARQAKQAAQQNLDLISQQYKTGQIEILTLLDAQKAMLEAEEMLHNAIYDCILGMVTVQHKVGRFHFLMQPQEKIAWQQRLDVFLARYQ